MELTGNTIFIPGATSGIGLAMARSFKERGNTVIVGGRRQAILDELAAEGFATVAVDVADAESITAAAAHVIDAHPEVDTLITMAGIMRVEDWHTSAGFLASAEAIVTTNLLGTIRLIAAFVEHLQTRPRAQVLTVSSGLASVPLAFTPSYNATKAGVHMLTESVRLQLADTNVQVIEIAPPQVQTALIGQEDVGQPLQAFVDETLALLEAEPQAKEILVEDVKLMRFAEANGKYDEVVAMINGAR